MNANIARKFPARLTFAIVAAAAVLVIGAATASGQEAPSTDQSSGGGVSGSPGSIDIGVGSDVAVSPPDVAVSSGIAMPAWCCAGGTSDVPGLTTYGQAPIDSADPVARDAAIAAAVQDATAQANAAAEAAGIALGPIVDMQVSAAPYYYDYPMVGTTVGGSSPGSAGGGGGMEPAPAPGEFYGTVSVTMTWALG